MRFTLTRRQRQALKAIQDFQARVGEPPSPEALGAALGVTASSARRLIENLVGRGYAVRLNGSRAYALATREGASHAG